jgi:ribose transport system permease protein
MMLTSLRKKWHLNIPGIFWGIVALVIFFGVSEKNFFTPYNLILIARNACILLLASVGMTLAVLVSQIDLSIGSVISLTAVVLGFTVSKGLPVGLCIILAFLVGAVIGSVNGIMIAKLKFDYWITTFATMSIGAGLALVAAGGNTIPIKNSLIDWLGNGKILGLYAMIWITAILILVMFFVLKRTRLGYNIYSIGGAENVAGVSGIDVVRNRFTVYVISGIFASVAGILIAGMTTSASPIVGTEYSFNAIAAVVIGGTSFDGGKGGLIGTLLGTLLLRVLASGLSMMGVSSVVQKVIIGLVIVGLIVADQIGEKIKKKDGLRRVYADAE